MRWPKILTIVIIILIFMPSSVSATEPDPSFSFDSLDPRLPRHNLSLIHRLQIGSGKFSSSQFNPENYSYNNGFNKQIINYLKNERPYGINFQKGDFRLTAGFRFKEDWLGFIENDVEYSNLQSSITFCGKAVIKDKIEIYHDLTAFRGDSTVDLDSASTTGEFLVDPLLSYNYAHRGAIASGVDVFELQTDRAIIKTELYGIKIKTGRERLQLKRGYRVGLMLSGLTRPVDMFYRLDYDFWRFGFTALAGRLTEAGQPSETNRRYLSIKRVTARISNGLQLGATEAVAYADDPTAYINPIMLFYIVHRHRPSNDDNLIASVDFSYTPVKNLNIYGEFLDDDLIIFEGGASKYGFMLGIFKSQLLTARLDFRIEYAQVRKWTYTHVSHINAWEYRDLPFGFWLGPDADELFTQANYLFSPATALSLNLDIARKGEGNLFNPYEDEWGDKKPPFPSGVVEKSTGGWFDFRHEYSRIIIRARLGYRRIENRHNQADNFDNYFSHLVFLYKL